MQPNHSIFQTSGGRMYGADSTRKPSLFWHTVRSILLMLGISIVVIIALQTLYIAKRDGTVSAAAVTTELTRFTDQYRGTARVETDKLSGTFRSAISAARLPKFPANFGVQVAIKPAAAKPLATHQIAEVKPATPEKPIQFDSGVPAGSQLPGDNSAKAPTDTVQYRNGHYAYGQCTYYVASRRPVPPQWGNARDWMYHAKLEGYRTGDIAVAGAVAWTPAGRYGHVAYVEQVVGDQVQIAEMNYAGWNRVSRRWVAMSAFRYIY